MTTMIDDRVRKLATRYSHQLQRDKRNDGKMYVKFECKTKDEEERCRKLAFAAHGEMLPDDWKYEFIHEALLAIEEASDLDAIDLEADIYTSDLTAWLASRVDRMAYCDSAVENGLCSADADMITRLQLGQYQEKQEVLYAVLQYLRNEAKQMESAE